MGRIDNDHIPKKLLFGELVKKYPFHGPKKRWCDEVMGDLRAIGVEDGWSRIVRSGQSCVPVLLMF